MWMTLEAILWVEISKMNMQRENGQGFMKSLWMDR